MFRRGSFSFDTRGPNTIRLELVGSVEAAADGEAGDLPQVMGRVRAMLESNNKDGEQS
jgi:hypothetical protein